MRDRVIGVPAPYHLAIGSSAFPGFLGVVAPVIDMLLIVSAGLISREMYQLTAGTSVDLGVYLSASILLALIFTTLMRGRGLYDPTSLLSLERQLRQTLFCWLTAFAVVMTVGFLSKTSADLSRGSAVTMAFVGLLGLAAQRVAWRFGLRGALAAGAIRRRHVIVLTPSSRPLAASQNAAIRSAGIEVVQTFALPVDPAERSEIVTQVLTAVRRPMIDEVLVALPSSQLFELDIILDELRTVPLPIRLLPDSSLSRIALQPSRPVGGFALIDIRREPLSGREMVMKRALDIIVASGALVAAAPLMTLAMLAVKLDSPGPAFFRQSRRGFNGRTFKILKLRTMSVLEDGDGISQARRRDPRVTRVGYWLRRTSIDELPQLWNVLRGEMSVVGPRPHAVAHDNYYDQLIENYAFRHHVKPGLTGWAQVSGHRGETPDVAMMAARIDHDVWYIENWSILLDIRILFLTGTRLLAPTAY